MSGFGVFVFYLTLLYCDILFKTIYYDITNRLKSIEIISAEKVCTIAHENMLNFLLAACNLVTLTLQQGSSSYQFNGTYNTQVRYKVEFTALVKSIDEARQKCSHQRMNKQSKHEETLVSLHQKNTNRDLLQKFIGWNSK